MKYYFKLFLRRLPIFMLVAMVISVISFGVAMSLPPVYVSQARFLLESSQIPNALAPPTVKTPAREQLQLFGQKLLNRTNLLDIARRLEVFPGDARMTPDEIYNQMADQTTVSSSLGKGGAAILTVKFEARSGKKAAAVMNEYMAIIQRADLESRTGRAGQTLEFFQQEADRLSSELAGASAKLIEFKTANSDALPDGQSYRLGQQGILQERIAQADRDVSTLKAQRARLIEIFNSTGQVEGIAGVKLTPEQKQLEDLRRQLTAAQAVYAPTHPKIKVLDGQIKQLETVVAQQLGAEQTGASPLDLQLADIDSRIGAIEDQKSQTQAGLDKLNDAIARTAANGVQLEMLQRDYVNIQTQYNGAVADLAKASTGERIELLSRGERLTVLEQPVAPNSPARPNRVLLAGGGTAFGILAGLGLIVLIEMLNRAPRRPEAIVRKLGITPLATLPYIQSSIMVQRRRRLTIIVTLAIMIGVPLLVWLVHSYYMPLDLLAQKVGKKFGLRW